MQALAKKHSMLLAVLLIACCARWYFLTTVQRPVYDETMNIPSAINYVETGYPLPGTWYHPNLSNILMYLSMRVFGNDPLGWRLPNAFFGVLSICLVYLLAMKLFSSGTIAVVAAFLLAIDPLHIMMSRSALGEPASEVFALLAILFAVLYAERARPALLVLSGAALGLGISLKWYAVLTAALVLAVASAAVLRNETLANRRSSEALFVFSALVLLPATIYLLTFLPWFGRGYSLVDFLWLQRDMYSVQQSFTDVSYVNLSLLTSKVESWFTVPSLGGFRLYNRSYAVAALYTGNPFIWLLTLPAMAVLMYRCFQERSALLAVAPAAFLVQYAPLLAVKRPIFVHSAMSVLPFAMIAIAYVLVRFATTQARTRLLAIYLGLNLLLVAYLFPFLAVYPVSPDVYHTYYAWLDRFLVVAQ